jgi:NADP-dependent alcohol dehydrogenase
MSNPSIIKSAIPFGSVLTLPATGSEMNPTAVISRAEKGEKLPFSHTLVYPKFSILDPVTTFSLPEAQSANGVVDSFIHVTEQYLTFPNNAPLQDRQAEAILLTLIEEGRKVIDSPWDYDARANIMWCATQALNGLIGCGVPQDWATHMIGHELTALYGIDHARTLAVVLPALLRYRKKEKSDKLLQFASRIWGINSGKEDERIEAAIVKMEEFFKSLGIPVKLSEYGVDKKLLTGVGERIESRRKLGESGDIGAKEVSEILELAW